MDAYGITMNRRKRPFLAHLFRPAADAICSHRQFCRWRTGCRQFANVTVKLFGGRTMCSRKAIFSHKKIGILLRKDWHPDAIGALIILQGAARSGKSSPAG